MPWSRREGVGESMAIAAALLQFAGVRLSRSVPTCVYHSLKPAGFSCLTALFNA
jgi:hypothetical protein